MADEPNQPNESAENHESPRMTPDTLSYARGEPSGSTFGLRNVIVLLLVLGIGLCFLSVMLSSAGSRELPVRGVCSANLKGIGTSFATYANENMGVCPIALHKPATQPGWGEVTYAPKKIGLHRGQSGQPQAGQSTVNDTELSVTRNLWTLVRLNFSSPKSFTCPASKDKPNDEDVPQDFWDFRKYTENSYGYQVPYGQEGQPHDQMSASMAIAADRGPYGAAMEAGKRHPGVPTANLKSTPEDWERWNSPNHGGEGQQALYGDGHAEFRNKPTAGEQDDNIYTRWSDASGGFAPGGDPNVRVQGTPPTGRETPFSDTDSLIYP